MIVAWHGLNAVLPAIFAGWTIGICWALVRVIIKYPPWGYANGQ